jgi:transcriptional regulator with XRE-family HTH domain
MPKPDPVKLAARGQRLTAARQAKQLTQAQVAQCLGRDVATVSRWEQGSIDPSVDDLKALCELYGATVDSILAD